MRLAYLDGSAGASGDMILGAFLHAGVSPDVMQQALDSLHLNVSLKINEVDRCGIHAIKADIMDGEVLAEHPQNHHFEERDHDSRLTALNKHLHEHHGEDVFARGREAEINRKNEHSHEARSLATIVKLIKEADLSDAVKSRAIRTFTFLGEAEAKIHHVPIASVHFHEVGAVDSIADIVLAAVASEALEIDGWHCSPLNVGGGTVECAHGRFPVPAPATEDLLRGIPTYSSGINMELVTPTGAALIRAFDCQFGPRPNMTVTQIGYGAGRRNPPRFANVLRLSIGEGLEKTGTETVLVMETAVDDLNPQILGYVMEKALAIGALDVMYTPVFMKKNRPGTLLTVLTDHQHLSQLEKLLLSETTTLGLRIHEERRTCLDRRLVDVSTPWGTVQVKIGTRLGLELNASPEFDQCRKIAETYHLPVKHVLETALQSYRAMSS